MTLDAFRSWYARWYIELYGEYGESIRWQDFEDHWPGTPRSLYSYRKTSALST
jgi:hypothetical protein